MNHPEPTPLHCRHVAFETLVQQLEALDTTRGLLRCAVAVSMHELDGVDGDEIEAQIDALAGTITDRVCSGDPRALLAHAHAVLFDEARFLGNTKNYDDPANSYLPRVLTTRRGLPITLTLLYKCVLETVGLRVVGINAPGHFLAGVIHPELSPRPQDDQEKRPPLLVDAFHGGRVLTRDEAFKKIEDIAGGAVARDDALLRPASHAHWLIRLIQNLAHAFEKRQQRDDRAAMLELRTLVETVR
jgi:regulator of sirC expression with transglutaminase-like and TPR domain